MKKVMLLSAAVLMSASVFVSCGGPSEEEQKRIADSLAKALTAGFDNMAKAMDSAANAATTAVDSAAATTTAPATEEKK